MYKIRSFMASNKLLWLRSSAILPILSTIWYTKHGVPQVNQLIKLLNNSIISIKPVYLTNIDSDVSSDGSGDSCESDSGQYAGEANNMTVYLKVLEMQSVVAVRPFNFKDNIFFPIHGTGYMADNTNNYIVTNSHVAEGSAKIEIEFYNIYKMNELFGQQSVVSLVSGNADIERVIGDVVYVEQHTDMALIQLVDVLPGILDQLELATDLPELGEPIFILGNGDIHFTPIDGIITRVSVSTINNGYDIFGLDIDNNKQLVYHNAKAMAGYSGCPVIDSQTSQVVGTEFAYVFGEFEVAINDVLGFIERAKLYRDKQLSVNRRQKLRKRYAKAPADKLLGMVLTNTFEIITVLPDCPLKYFAKYDCIHSINGQLLTNMKQLTDAINGTNGVNKNIKIKVRHFIGYYMNYSITPLSISDDLSKQPLLI